MENKNEPPVVSIICLVYNHGDYLRSALDGFLIQRTNFNFEIIVHDDASIDVSTMIIREYEKKFPKIFRPIYQIENQHSIEIGRVTKLVFNSARGKYIALCEGDDYWIDPYKLQKQYDFLEANNDYGMICTDYHKYFQDKNILKKNCFLKGKYNNSIEFNDYILDRSTIGTATAMFRSDLMKKFEEDIPSEIRKNWNVGDTALWLYFSLVSKIKVLPDVTAVYRINKESASKFVDIHRRYQFRIKGFEIPFFFLDFSNADRQLREKLEISYNGMFIRYRYDAKDSSIGIENYKKLRELKAISFDIWIRFNFYNKHLMAKYCLFPVSYAVRKAGNIIAKFKKLYPLIMIDFGIYLTGSLYIIW